MFTLCYPFRPWSGARAIVDGSSILDYVRETAVERGIDQRIRFHHRVVRAGWCSADARWTIVAEGSLAPAAALPTRPEVGAARLGPRSHSGLLTHAHTA